MNNFERWKAQLTIDGLIDFIFSIDCCDRCPIYSGCAGLQKRFCIVKVKEWGEQDAD